MKQLLFILALNLGISFAGGCPEWLATQHHANPQLITALNQFVEESASKNSQEAVLFSNGENFGQTQPTKHDVEGRFLKEVHELSTQISINTLEIGCSKGLISLKVPFCFEEKSKHIGIDLSSSALGAAKKKAKALLKPFELDKSCHFKNWDLFALPSKAPQYQGKFQFVYSQNVVHFSIKPEQALNFFKIIDWTLAPGGRAFISAEAPDVRYVGDLYTRQAQDPNNIFPGLITWAANQVNLADGRVSIMRPVIEVRPAHEDDTQTPQILESFHKNIRIAGTTDIVWHLVHTVRSTLNFFTPEVFRRVVAQYHDLEIVDTYFVNMEGRRMPSEELGEFLTAVAIIQKKSASVVLNLKKAY